MKCADGFRLQSNQQDLSEQYFDPRKHRFDYTWRGLRFNLSRRGTRLPVRNTPHGGVALSPSEGQDQLRRVSAVPTGGPGGGRVRFGEVGGGSCPLEVSQLHGRNGRDCRQVVGGGWDPHCGTGSGVVRYRLLSHEIVV